MEVSVAASSMVAELENLRALLDKPAAAIAADPAAVAAGPPTTYAGALNTAEVSVERLSKAMEAAEDEMESAFKRTGELHRNNAAKKEQELQELRRVVAAKEKSIDSLREQLSSLKRMLEGRAQQAEDQVIQKDLEVRQLQEQMLALQQAKEQSDAALNDHAEALEQLQQDCTNWQQQAQAASQRAEEQAAAAADKLRQGQHLQNELKAQVEGLQAQLASAQQQLNEKAASQDKQREQMNRELRALRKRLNAEKEEDLRDLKLQLKMQRKARKAAERWLRMELKSREEIEELFVSVRDMILSRPDGDVAEVKWLLDHLPSAQQQGGRRQQQHLDSIGQLIQEMALGPPHGPLRELKADYDAQRRQLEQENASLRAEVEHTRLLLAQPSGDMQTIAAVERQHSSGSRVQLAQGMSREHSPGKQVLSEDNARLKRELVRLRDRSMGHSKASKGAASGNAEDDVPGSQHLLQHNSVTWQ